jgi:hypothetical protein
MRRAPNPRRPLRLPLAALLALAVAAGCARDEILPGERFPVRPADPTLETPAAVPGITLPPAQVNADWTHRQRCCERAHPPSGARRRAGAALVVPASARVRRGAPG